MKHKHFKHLFTALLLLCSTVVTAHDFKVGGIYYKILSEEDKTVEVTYKGNSRDEYSNEYTGSVVIPETVTKSEIITTVLGTFDAWTSTNKGSSGTTSQKSYTLNVKAGDILNFDWSVSSESNYDWLTITLDGTEILKKSGTDSGSYEKTFTTSGAHTLVVKYTKDGSVNKGDDEGKIYNITLSGVSGASGSANNTVYRVTNIGSDAFSNCSGLTSIEIPNSVTSIGDWAFFYCTSLTSVEIPNSVTSIGNGAFANCTGLTSIVIPSSVTSIEKRAFNECSGLTSIEIPNSVTSIGDYAFFDCTSLTSVEIPNSVTSIGDYAFSGCTDLTRIVIPSSVTSIEERAFAFCNGLKSITSLIPADKLFAVVSYVFYNVNKNACTLYVPYGAKETYAATSGWSAFANIVELIPENAVYGSCGADATWILIDGVLTIKGSGGIESNPWIDYAGEIQSIIIEDGITSICNDAFNGCSALTSITIPGSVTSIGDYAFYDCYRLTSVIIPNSVTSIGNNAFSNCYDLASIVVDGNNTKYDSRENCNAIIETETNTLILGCNNTVIPNSVTSIGKEAFYNCYGLTSIEIPGSVTSIGDYAFRFCANLTSIEIPNSVTFIGNWAFSSCSSLTSIEIPSSVTSIGDYAFGDCTGLTSIVIPNGVTSIGFRAFIRCSGLTSVEIPNSVTFIGDDAFFRCSGLTSVEIPSSVTSIGESAFEDCYGLTSVEIPSSVTSIGNYAFRDCSGLTSIEIPNSVTSIGQEAFSGCDGLTSIVIGNSVTSIGVGAFSGCDGLTSIEIPNSVTSIGNSAFDNCSGLTSVEIPNSITSIGEWAFSGCTGLTIITSLIPADALFAVSSYTFYNVDKNTCTLYVPYGAKETYASTKGWNVFTNIVELDPTEVTITINQYGSATFCSDLALDFSEVEGLKAYSAIGYKPSTQVVTLARVMTTGEGQGIFIKGEPGEYTVPVIDEFDEYTLNMLVGTLEQTVVNSTDGAMSNYKFTILPGDETPMFYPFEDNTTLSAGKAYLQIPTAWLPATAQKSLSIRFDDGTTTDIDEVKGESGEVKGVCYDMQGRVVENPTSGIYIIDGKKVLIK